MSRRVFLTTTPLCCWPLELRRGFTEAAHWPVQWLCEIGDLASVRGQGLRRNRPLPFLRSMQGVCGVAARGSPLRRKAQAGNGGAQSVPHDHYVELCGGRALPSARGSAPLRRRVTAVSS